MKHGIRIPPDKRPAMARRAFEIVEAGGTRWDAAAELDVSEPTARNLINAGRRLVEGDTK